MVNSFKPVLLIWGIVCLLQAFFTELHPDEAYYWVYSQHLDWGQFHQPPMIAVFIKIGYFLFENELGVRLISIATHLFSLALIFKMVQPKKPWLFGLALASLFLLHAGALLAVPDSPLVFFSVLFLWFLKKYLNHDSYTTALILALIAACILYSKYHGILFLGFCLLPNLKILKRKSFWLIPVLSFLLFVPHILWQIEYDYPSFRFHLFNREMVPWKWTWILEYIGGQVLFLGPVGLILFYFSYKNKSNSAFDKTLFFTSSAIFLFFLILSFRNKTEANWTALAFIPLIISGGKLLESVLKSKVLLGVVSLIVLFIFTIRIELATGLFKPDLNLNFKYKFYNSWADAINKKAGEMPVIFMDSYQLPSLYWFYTGEKSMAYSTAIYPGNQYDFYDFIPDFNGEKIMVIQTYLDNCPDPVVLPDREICYDVVDVFWTFRSVWMEYSPPKTVKPGEEFTIEIIVHERFPSQDSLQYYADMVYNEYAFIWIQRKQVKKNYFSRTKFNVKHFEQTLHFTLKAPEKEGRYLLSSGILSFVSIPGRNSYFYPIEVKK